MQEVHCLSGKTVCVSDDSWYGEGCIPLSKEQWEECLNDPQIIPAWGIDLLQKWMDVGGVSSCMDYALRFHIHPSTPIFRAVNLGKRIHKFTQCDVRLGSGGKPAWFSVAFLGRYNDKHYYDWKVRPELQKAWQVIYGTNKKRTI